VLGILDVNGWHNVVHIATGALGLAVARSYDGSRGYAIGLGIVYLVVAVLGFIAGNGDEIFNLIPVNTEDNVLHLLIGIAGLGAGFATPATTAPSTARPAAAEIRARPAGRSRAAAGPTPRSRAPWNGSPPVGV
jgi:hypothetical protein